MNWRVEVRDAINPPTLYEKIQLLITDTPARPASDIQTELEKWIPLMKHDGWMVIGIGVDPIELPFPNTVYIGHDDCGRDLEGFNSKYIAFYTHENDLVVDPYCGWSTAGVVALDMGRRYLGCDIHPMAVFRSLEAIDAWAS